MLSKRLNTVGLITSLVVLAGCSGDSSSPKIFSMLPASETGISFENKLEKKDMFNILYYLYYYNGGGVATGDINNDGLPDIYFTANSKGGNKLYLNKGHFKFEDITVKAGVAGSADWCSGVTMADVNGDGYLDIYVCASSQHHGLNGRNELFINNKNNSFTESASKYGLDFSGFGTQAAFFDYDHDGDLDCYLLNHSQKPHSNITDTSNRRKYDPLTGDRLYRQDSMGKFTDVSAQAGIFQSSLGYGLGLAVADINNDGWEDIYVGNDFHENDYYYVNNGNGTFTESGAQHFRHYSRFSMGNDVADYDNDGQLDVITVDMLPFDEKVLKTYGSDENPDTYKLKLTSNGYQNQNSKNCLQHNNGNGSSFSETALASGVSATDWSWSPLFADFDNDGNKDLFISTGIVKRPVDLDYVKFVSDLVMKVNVNDTRQFDDEAINKMPGGSCHPFFFKGDGKINFTDVSEAWGSKDIDGFFTGASYADLDNDGNLDVVINSVNAPAMILKNNSPQKKVMNLVFSGNDKNTQGIGVKAWLFAGGKMQYQQLMPTRGFQSSSELRLHFGLDTLRTIDSMLIVWPNQKYQWFRNTPAIGQMEVKQIQSGGVFNYNSFFPSALPVFSVDTSAIAWKHQEDHFLDYDMQYLIPHAESTRGPKIAVADVNGDGLDDLYACGAKGQPGTLMLQQKNGTFINPVNDVFTADAAFEDVDALFFDANGDGKPDLYVVSGGNEYSGPKDSSYLDRLYLNDGNGKFSRVINALPVLFDNKSCVATADVDKDGDMDLFVGSLSDPIAYGVPQTSHLLINDGKGIFTVSKDNDALFKDIGMVTSCSFTDLDKDSWPDLAVGGEFMPLTVFINHQGKLKRSFLPASTGLWQSVAAQDVDGDGNTDLLAGNWGWNNKFWSGKNGPVKLYVADFDKNGRTDQLLSYTLNGVEYPFLAKDEVERPLPLLKKHYLLYADYGGVPMKDVFYGWIDSTKPIIAERLGSIVAYGDGKGNFKIEDLPVQLQLAPIFSFSPVGQSKGENEFIAGGNFFDVIPYEGRYDAQPLGLFSVNRQRKIVPIRQSNLSGVDGQVRDLKWFKRNNEPVLLVARNNGSILELKRTKTN